MGPGQPWEITWDRDTLILGPSSRMESVSKWGPKVGGAAPSRMRRTAGGARHWRKAVRGFMGRRLLAVGG